MRAAVVPDEGVTAVFGVRDRGEEEAVKRIALQCEL